MNLSRYQALQQTIRECQRDANLQITLAIGSLGYAVGMGEADPRIRLILSTASVACAWLAKESRTSASEAEIKASRYRLQLQELETTEAALEFATAKVALEESYGLLEPNTLAPETQVPEYRSPPSPSTPRSQDWEDSDDFGFAALAPDAKAEIRDWLSLEFACSSKVVCAASGSGKSSYLRWEYRQASQDRTTYLIDGHLLSNHLEGQTWTGSKEADLRIVSHTEYQISRTLTDLIAEIKARLKGQRPLDPVHVLIDEADGNIFKDSEIQALLKEFVELIANESRKTKVTLTFVVHTVLQKKTGLDASDLLQIKWLILGNALATRDGRWPTDLDPKEWRARQSMLQDSLDSNQARACVLYQQSGISLEVLEWEFLKG